MGTPLRRSTDGRAEEAEVAQLALADSSTTATRAAPKAAAAAAAAAPPLSGDPKSLAEEVRQLRAEVALQMQGMEEVRKQMERVLAMVATQQPAGPVPSPSLSGARVAPLNVARLPEPGAGAVPEDPRLNS